MKTEKMVGTFCELEERLLGNLLDVSVGLLQFKISEQCSVYSTNTKTMKQAEELVFLWTMPNGVSYGSPEAIIKNWFLPYVADIYKAMLASGEYTPFALCKTIVNELEKVTVELMGE